MDLIGQVVLYLTDQLDDLACDLVVMRVGVTGLAGLSERTDAHRLMVKDLVESVQDLLCCHSILSERGLRTQRCRANDRARWGYQRGFARFCGRSFLELFSGWGKDLPIVIYSHSSCI